VKIAENGETKYKRSCLLICDIVDGALNEQVTTCKKL